MYLLATAKMQGMINVVLRSMKKNIDAECRKELYAILNDMKYLHFAFHEKNAHGVAESVESSIKEMDDAYKCHVVVINKPYANDGGFRSELKPFTALILELGGDERYRIDISPGALDIKSIGREVLRVGFGPESKAYPDGVSITTLDMSE